MTVCAALLECGLHSLQSLRDSFCLSYNTFSLRANWGNLVVCPLGWVEIHSLESLEPFFKESFPRLDTISPTLFQDLDLDSCEQRH